MTCRSRCSTAGCCRREAARGLMVLSYLDKAPFYASERYCANQSFGGFRAEGDGAVAHVMLYASTAQAVAVACAAPAGVGDRAANTAARPG